MYMLSRMNININSLGNNKTCAMVYEFYSSHFFTSNVCVHQGDAISLICFNLYVSNIQSLDLRKIRRLYIHLYRII